MTYVRKDQERVMLENLIFPFFHSGVNERKEYFIWLNFGKVTSTHDAEQHDRPHTSHCTITLHSDFRFRFFLHHVEAGLARKKTV